MMYINGKKYMNTKSKNKSSLEEKLIKGTNSALKKLIAERKKNNDYLIISRDGKVVKIKAKDL